MMPIMCDEHDVAMVRDEPLCMWICPVRTCPRAISDEDVYRLSARTDAKEIRVT